MNLRSKRTKNNNAKITVLVGAFFFFVGCQSTKQVVPVHIAPEPVVQSPSIASTFDAKIIDNWFENKNCAGVVESFNKSVGAAPDSASLWTHLAIKYCLSETDPKNQTKLTDALAAINEVEKRYIKSSVVSSAKLAELRALRYLAADDKDNALKNFVQSRDMLLEGTLQARTLEVQILDLAAATNSLSAPERSKIQELMAIVVKDDRLFEALASADQLLSEVKSKEAQSVIYEERNRILVRIELLFAINMSQLEGFKNRGQDMELRELAVVTKKKFPQKNYEIRIDSLLMAAPSAAGAVSPPGPPSVASTLLADSLNDAQKVERVLQEARAALDSGQAPKAVEIIDTLPAALQTDKSKRLRKEASEVHVRDLRAHVRALYTRSQSQPTKPAKIEVLVQAKQTLESILLKYPTTSVKVAVERNLKSVNEEIAELGKTK